MPPVGDRIDGTEQFCFESTLWIQTFPQVILLKKISKPLLNNTYPKNKIEKFLNTLIDK